MKILLTGIALFAVLSNEAMACYTNMECFNGSVCVKPSGSYESGSGICMAPAAQQYQPAGATKLEFNPADIARDYQANQINNLELQKRQIEIQRMLGH